MKKRLVFISVFCISFLIACNNTSEKGDTSTQEKRDIATEESADNMFDVDTYLNNGDNSTKKAESADNNNASDNKNIKEALDRKVIYTAHLQIEVKSYQKTVNSIQTKVEKFNGYIVESNMYENQENDAKSGQITARIPQERFQEFIQLVEEGSNKVLESSTFGQDVTEEYVDLESRLKSKRIVEERLLAFMKDATKTEDLLQISSDLADVQEEIEEVTGRMKYLENKSDLATVTIDIHEKNVAISSTGKDDLNTWEQTKQQFMKSINIIITAFSNLFVFLIGNLPVIILIGIIGLLGVMIIKRKRNRS